MPALDALLVRQLRAASDLAAAGESVRSAVPSSSALWRLWNVSKLEALYELAFLRSFVAWEMFLEATFYRCLCGYIPKAGTVSTLGPVLLKGSVYPNIAAAEGAILGTQQYIAWYKCKSVIDRCQRYIVNGHHEATIVSHQSRLEKFAAIRHRIAHGQGHAKSEFDIATKSLNGKAYRGSRPGRFLRDWDTAAWPRRTWLETILDEFGRLATQIV
jgi:hypothetical protein